MFHGKPLYIAFAQRKEDRKTQLKLHYAPQQARLNGSSAAVVPGGFSSFFYPNVTSHMLQSGLLYQPLGLGPGWRANDFTLPTRSFQQSQVPIVSANLQKNFKKINVFLPFYIILGKNFTWRK